jgi:hypothetical protein
LLFERAWQAVKINPAVVGVNATGEECITGVNDTEQACFAGITDTCDDQNYRMTRRIFENI